MELLKFWRNIWVAGPVVRVRVQENAAAREVTPPLSLLVATDARFRLRYDFSTGSPVPTFGGAALSFPLFFRTEADR
jgi:hypothetical protein